ncbi:MAG: hypothetical protein KJO07_11865 [Deltaproteobacteria bacterium]|nr:hypothetical protein [Deltaproteobacteria bacterium]
MRAWGWSVLVVVLVGCGGDDNPACETFSACGGDPVGSWQATATCTTGVSEQEEVALETCPEASIFVVTDFAGSLDIEGDGTYAFDFEITTLVDLTLPPSCLAQVTSCEQLDETCSGNVDQGCRCSFQQVDESADTSTWSTGGSVLDLDNVTWDYCVNGDRLTMRTFEESTNLTYTLVLERR